MQFSCESCKTNLQIADEKVRGKRLVVRCKRCGAKITIHDPALHRSAPPPAAAAPAPVPVSAPAPLPAKPTPGELDHRPRETDTESTRAMDSELLEKAVQASRRDEPLALDALKAAPRPAPAPPPPAPAAEPGVWFAMLAGKQTGPLTRGELDAKTAQGAVGPRTYLWKEGMPSWQRAKDLPELAALFPPPPPPLPPPVNAHPALESKPFDGSIVTPVPGSVKAVAPAKEKEEERTAVDPLPLGERVHQEKVAGELFTAEPSRSAADLARWASEELAKKRDSRPEMPRVPPPRSKAPLARESTRQMFARHVEPKNRAPLIVVLLVLLAAAGVAAWLYLGQPEAPKPAESALPPRPEQPAAAAAAKPPPPEKEKEKPAGQPPQTGLTADQVRRKLDENKSALQGCIDEALRRDPNLRVGKIHIATTIAPSGQVTTAKIDKRTVNDSPLGSCLKRATMHIVFPGFAGDPFDVDIPIVVTASE
jgi:predicted Zn finger-like uncharacterized protein